MRLNSRKYAIKSLNSFYALQCSLNVCYKYEKKTQTRSRKAANAGSRALKQREISKAGTLLNTNTPAPTVTQAHTHTHVGKSYRKARK